MQEVIDPLCVIVIRLSSFQDGLPTFLRRNIPLTEQAHCHDAETKDLLHLNGYP